MRADLHARLKQLTDSGPVDVVGLSDTTGTDEESGPEASLYQLGQGSGRVARIAIVECYQNRHGRRCLRSHYSIEKAFKLLACDPVGGFILWDIIVRGPDPMQGNDKLLCHLQIPSPDIRYVLYGH
jgi:hypothetical protein